MERADTIAAVATAPGAGGVGIVRISGPDAGAIARRLLGHEPMPRHAHYAVWRDAQGGTLDQGLMLWFPTPHSYTGEDVLELQAHGSPLLLDLLLRHVCSLGARPARAGEFSQRAFLNGKLDLAQAEAIADLIAAGSESALRAAQRSLAGAFSRRVEHLQTLLTTARVQIEAALDFPDEEIELLADPALVALLDQLAAAASDVLAETRRGVRLARGTSVVLVGRPNAGKSSLLNALAGEERAIVTAVPGTTRDVLRVELLLDGVRLELADTAGLHEAGDEIEREGMRRAITMLGQADLAVLVTRTGTWREDLAALRAQAPAAAVLCVLNKIDLEQGQPVRIEAVGDEPQRIALSAATGAGLGLLREALHRQAGGGAGEATAYSARVRHALALERAAEAIESARTEVRYASAQPGHGLAELAAEALRRAQRELDELTGAHGSDDLLGAIFSSFCIGK